MAIQPHSESTQRHKTLARQKGPVPVALITVSDSRTPETDTNKHFLEEQIGKSGHKVVAYRLIKDEPDEVERTLDELTTADARVLLWNGGTGISPRDTTFDVLNRRLEKTISGFGELFRFLSYEQVGSAAMLSRAVAGVYRSRIIISIPGSPAAVRLAWEKLIEPELEHLAWEVVRR